MPRNNTHKVYRSAVNGQFVKENYAKKNPDKTIKESVPNAGYGDTGRRKK